jgi:hypothetical protein
MNFPLKRKYTVHCFRVGQELQYTLFRRGWEFGNGGAGTFSSFFFPVSSKVHTVAVAHVGKSLFSLLLGGLLPIAITLGPHKHV